MPEDIFKLFLNSSNPLLFDPIEKSVDFGVRKKFKVFRENFKKLRTSTRDHFFNAYKQSNSLF